MLNLLSLKKLSPRQQVGGDNSNGGMIVKKVLFLVLFALLPSIEIWADNTTDTAPQPPPTTQSSPNSSSPATIQSVTDASKDIVETLVSLISGLAATASDLIYMNTPSSVIAMNTNSALLNAQQELQKSLVTNADNPTKLALTGYLGFANPVINPNEQATTPPPSPIAPLPNSGTLVLDIYDRLEANLISSNRQNDILVPATVSKPFYDLMDAKKACMPSSDSKNSKASCTNIIEYEAGKRQEILQAIFTDALAANYAEGDRIYNAELLFSSNDPVIPILINQLSQLGGTPDPRPPHLPEPMSSEELTNVNNQINNDLLGKSPTTLDSIHMQQQAYSQAVMQLIAAKNLVMNNFNLIHNKRVSQETIASQNLKDENGATIETPLQLESYAAKRRLTPDYYKEIAGAPPAAIARETLFALAEIREQLHQNQLMSERFLATLSVIALGSFREKNSEIDKLSQGLDTQIKMLTSGTMAQTNDLKGGIPPNAAFGSPQ